MATVNFKNIVKVYEGSEIPAVNTINMDINDGEFVVLVGPSGCGKSTLLRMIAGLEYVNEGSISIDSNDITNMKPSERNIAMVFQNYALYPHMNIADNIGFHLKIAKMPQAEIDQKVGEVAEKLQLTDYLERLPANLSGGQRQRVAMGRAIVRKPQVFLFDEPLSNLDAKLRIHMRSEIKTLQREIGTTTIYVTHDQVEAMTMADKIAVMLDGQIQQYGTPLEVYDRPANRFVASFIGSPAMNFIEGDSNKTKTSLSPDGKIKIPLPKGIAKNAKGDISVGVRPEHVRIVKKGLPCTIEHIEPTGAETLLMLNLGGNKIIASIRERRNYKIGDTVQIDFDLEKTHVFCKQTDMRLN